MINAIPDDDEIAETLMELHGWARVERGEPDNRWMAHPTSLTDIYGWFTIDDETVAQAYLEATLKDFVQRFPLSGLIGH